MTWRQESWAQPAPRRWLWAQTAVAFRPPGKPLREPQEMTRAVSEPIGESKGGGRMGICFPFSTARTIREDGKGAEPLCPAQLRHGAHPLLVFPRLGAGASAVPPLGHEGTAPAHAPGALQPWAGSCCQPGPLLSPVWGCWQLSEQRAHCRAVVHREPRSVHTAGLGDHLLLVHVSSG